MDGFCGMGTIVGSCAPPTAGSSESFSVSTPFGSVARTDA